MLVKWCPADFVFQEFLFEKVKGSHPVHDILTESSSDYEKNFILASLSYEVGLTVKQ